jgi:glucose/arabinose dehydrogenase
MRTIVAGAAIALLAACGKPGGKVEPSAVSPPVETRPPHGVGQKPAFEGQTRAPLRTADVAYHTRRVARGLEHPWAIDFLADGRMLVTERPGRLRIVSPQGRLSRPVAGLPPVDAREQGGLLDVAVDPGFAANQTIYWSYAEPRKGGNGTALARGRLITGNGDPRVEDVQVLFRQMPTLESTKHFGSRIVFAPDGTLLLPLGERSILEGRVQAQDLGSHFGKIIRVHRDGSIPKDNPFVGRPGARPEIWSYGHRNIQSAAIHPATGALWIVDHGPKGGDELNAPEAGKNYGWPIITYGIEYTGEPVGAGITAREGMEQPLYYWDPVIAPSGMLFYTGDLFPAWKGSLFIGSLAGKHLARLTLEGKRVVGEERLLTDLRMRIRDVAQGPDGAIHVVTDEEAGRVLKLTPAATSGK